MEFKRQHNQDIPEGYFEQLEKRLNAIPAEHPHSSPRVIRMLRKSWVAAAAVAVLIALNFWMNSDANSSEGLSEEEYYEWLIANTEDYELLYYGLVEFESTESEDDLDWYIEEYTDYDIIGLE